MSLTSQTVAYLKQFCVSLGYEKKHYNKLSRDDLIYYIMANDKTGKYNFKMRFHQRIIVEKTLTAIEHDEKHILWGWKCRSGKSYGVGGLCLEYYKKYDRLNALIITPAPSETMPQFEEDLFKNYLEFRKFNVICITSSKSIQVALMA